MIYLMDFKDGKGHISVEDKYIICYFSDNENRSKKYPLSRVDDVNQKTLHDVLKMANLAGYELTEKGLKQFDEVIEMWKDNEEGTD